MLKPIDIQYILSKINIFINYQDLGTITPHVRQEERENKNLFGEITFCPTKSQKA